MNTHQLDVSSHRKSRGRAPSRAIVEGFMTDVLGTPMHSLTVPFGIKACIDQLQCIGSAFRSTPAGNVGNAAGSPRIHRFRRSLRRNARQRLGLFGPIPVGAFDSIGLKIRQFLPVEATAYVDHDQLASAREKVLATIDLTVLGWQLRGHGRRLMMIVPAREEGDIEKMSNKRGHPRDQGEG